ncbi:Na+/H+ antiporter [Pullulanibacillus camelliae]|uniref:Na+/H+ antiporter n=1 Tax=Pullulanibacillus camelliae TaxID=1707096 RepID=A0A8J2YFU7_9BACL|nr:sodium:proton antiporter [Pullulanibacillus camelliae]GGE34896.1 Na+/H+ antiporter [Pullulanibacillus camelliae]
MYTLEQFLIILAISAIVALGAKLTRLPYTIALVVVGLVLGTIDIPALEEAKTFITNNNTFHTVVIAIFLPALLGEAAIKLPYREFRTNQRTILLLAFGATLITFVIVGFGSQWVLGQSTSVAFTFAALMCATDPISVIGLFRTLGVEHRLSILVEGESLLNDGVAVVLFTIASTSLVTYINEGTLGFFHAIETFVWVVGGGALVGIIMGYIISKLIALIDDYPLEIVFSIICFFGSYLLSEQIHVSGVISVVIAGLIFGNYGAKIGMSPTTKLSISSFWDAISLLANSVIFLMVGLEIDRINFANHFWEILLAICLILIARAIATYSVLIFGRNLKRGWKHIIYWGGLRGSLSIALALSLPNGFPHRDDILVLAFSVVVFSLIIQGLTIKPLIQKLKLTKTHQEEEDYQDAIADIYRYEAAIEEIESARKDGLLHGESYTELREDYDLKLRKKQEVLNVLYQKYPDLKDRQIKGMQQRLLARQYEALNALESKELVSSSLIDKKHKEIADALEEAKES